MTNKQIAKYLQQAADLIELTNGNAFRARAFANASRTLQRLPEQVEELLAQDQLGSIQGIGSGLAKDIRTILETGTLPLIEELQHALPAGLTTLLDIKGIGVKKVRQLWQTRNITTLEALEQAARTNALVNLEGFGAKTQTAILEGIAKLQVYQKQRRYAHAFTLAEPLLKTLQGLSTVHSASWSGEMRRKMPTVSEVALLVAVADAEAFRAEWLTLTEPPAVLEFSPEGATTTLPDGFPVRIRLASPETFGTTLWANTGPEAFCAWFSETFGTPADFADETALFSSVNLPELAPELRDDAHFYTKAQQHSLPVLIEDRDLKGTLHNHSTWSDGAHRLADMAERAREMGLFYYGSCDHSRSLTVANGLSIERLAEQKREIEALNAQYAAQNRPFRIFFGIESDILKDGSLDYPDDVLADFDLVVASIHNGFNMTEDVATERLIRAIEHPATTILGHPTGRLLLARDGYPINHERVIAACATHHVAIELNANPYRLDLDWTWIRCAIEQGVKIAINPDAHSMDGLAHTHWGVEVARKAGLTARQCLNTMPLDVFADWLRTRKQGR